MRIARLLSARMSFVILPVLFFGSAIMARAQNIGRAALNQWWTTSPQYGLGLGTTTVGSNPSHVQSDGADLWVANNSFPGPEGTVSRVRGSDGKLLETWTGASGAYGVLVAMGRVFVTGISPSRLYMIDPTQPPGDVTHVANLGSFPTGIAFDGRRIWTANNIGSVSIVTPGSTKPWPTVNVIEGFRIPTGMLFDGTNIWITDTGANTLLRLDSAGAIAQTVRVGAAPGFPVFDGTNIWVPNRDNTITVVCAATGDVVETLRENGLNLPSTAAFDGQRVLVTNAGGDSVSLWYAADYLPLGSFSTGAGSGPIGVASNGINFWIALRNADKLARF